MGTEVNNDETASFGTAMANWQHRMGDLEHENKQLQQRLVELESLAAAQATQLLESTRYIQHMEADLQRCNNQLEGLVAIRTAELTLVNWQLQQQIVERRQAESILRDNEARYRSLFENSPISLWEIDFSAVKTYLDQLLDTGINNLRLHFERNPQVVLACIKLIAVVDVNQATLELYQAKNKADLLKQLGRIFEPETSPLLITQLEAIVEGHTRLDTEVITQTLQNKKIYIRMNWSVAPGHETTYAKVFVSLLDMTERRRIEQALHRYAARLQSLHQVDRDILAVRLPEEIAHIALSHMQNLIPFKWASVVEFDHLTNQAHLLAISGELHQPVGMALTAQHFNLDLLQQGHMFIVRNIGARPEPTALEQMLWDVGIRAYASVPLMMQDELIGTLNLGATDPNIFEPESLDIADEVAVTLAIAIRQARLYQQTRQDATTKATLLKEVNHRVKNNLTAIIGLLYAERRRDSVAYHQAYQSVLSDLISRIQGLATVHSLLSASEWGPLRLSELASRVIHSGLQIVPPTKNVVVKVPLTSVKVTPKQANSLALILSELTTNTVKHALVGRMTAHIELLFSHERDMIVLSFYDDGSGYPEELLTHQKLGVGWTLIQSIVRKELMGDVQFYNDNGAVATIRFKSLISQEINR